MALTTETATEWPFTPLNSCHSSASCVVEVLAFRAIVKEFDRNRWLALTFLSFLTCVLSLILFVMSGGSFHGDGGPIAFSFLLFWTIGTVVLPVSLVGLLIDGILRKRRSGSMFRR